MNEYSPRKYVPLSLTLNDGVLEPNAEVGSVWSSDAQQSISLVVSSDGAVYSGTREQPDVPVVFVNSSVVAFRGFVDAHSEYTNATVDKCQMDESVDFESVFVNDIITLVIAFRKIDFKALERREYWWPKTIDETIRQYYNR